MDEQELQSKYQQSTGENPRTSDFIRWRQHYIEKNVTIWEEKYIFLDAWNVYLVAKYDRLTDRQQLVMEEYCESTHSFILIGSINCIHTAITQRPVEELEQRSRDPDFQKEMLELWSSENHREVILSPEEKFFALKSWVQGIAQAGYEALIIQREIELYSGLMYPISQFLFQALLKVDINLTVDFIKWIKQRCIYNGDPHMPSLTANLLFISKTLFNRKIGSKSNWKQYEPIVNVFLEVVEYALDSKLNSKKFMIGPVNVILKFIDKFHIERIMLDYLNQVCDMFHIEDITRHPVLHEFITPLLDSLTCRFWVLQELINHLEGIMKKESRYSEAPRMRNELEVSRISTKLTSLDIRKKDINQALETLSKDGTVIFLETIYKKKKGKLAVPFNKYTDLKKLQYKIMNRLQFPFQTLPPHALFFKSKKYRYIFEQKPRIFIDSGWYWFYDVWIWGEKQYAIENKKTGDVFLNISRLGIISLNNVDGLSGFSSKLSHLDVSYNRIEDLSEISQFLTLTYLDLRGNPLDSSYLKDLHDLINLNSLLVTLKVDPEVIQEVARFLPLKMEEKMVDFCRTHWENVFGTPLELKLEEENEEANTKTILKHYVCLYNESAELKPPVLVISLINHYFAEKQKYADYWQMMQVLG